MTRPVAAMLRLMPMVVTMGIIFLFSHQPDDSLSLSAVPGVDKLAHMTVYGILAGTVLFAVSDRWKERNRRLVMILTVLFCTLYGISDEFHQSFVPGRCVSGYDLLADSCGAAITCLLWAGWRRKFAMMRCW